MNTHRLRTVGFAALFAAVGAAAPAAAAEMSADDLLDHDAAARLQWKERLGLNDQQLRKFSAAEAAREAALRPARAELREALVKLQGQLAENEPEAKVQESLQRVARARKALADENEKADAVLASFLSPSQRAKLLVWRSMMAGKVRDASGEVKEIEEIPEQG
jgi:Spy/CpxP family protein refolding chaperone